MRKLPKAVVGPMADRIASWSFMASDREGSSVKLPWMIFGYGMKTVCKLGYS